MSEQAKSQAAIYQLPVRIKGEHKNRFKSIKLTSNHYYLDCKNIEKIVIFIIKFIPKIPQDSSKMRNQLLNLIKDKISQSITNPIFSGRNIFTLCDPKSSLIQLTQQGQNIIIKKVRQYDISNNPKLFLTFMNNALRNSMRNINYVQIGRTNKYFNSKDFKEIDNLVMYNGFKSNFVELQKGIFLRVDSAKKIVRNQTVLEFIDHIVTINKNIDKQQRRLIIKQKLINQTVMSNYGKTVYHKIIDIKFEDMTTITFNTHQNQTLTLLEYYKIKYGINIKKPKQPLVVAEGRKKQDNIILIPQLLLMTGIPQDFDQFRRKKISQHTIKPPHQKYKEIHQFINKLDKTRQITQLQGLGIKLNRKMQKINGKQMLPPILQLGKNNQIDKGKQAFFNLFNKPIFSSKHSVNVGIIHFKGTQLQQMIQIFENTSRNLNADFNLATYELQNRNVRAIEQQISNCAKKHNICLIIIPAMMKNQYKQIKMTALKQNKILTQIMIDTQFQKKGFQSIATKILLQMIAKRGNILWVPRPLCKIDNIMLIGYDISKCRSQTIICICATINSTFNSIFSSIRIYNNNNDKYNKMIQLFLDACNSYMNRNKYCPKQIIIYINSCSIDQIKIYYQFFIIKLFNRYQEIYGNQNQLKLTVIMINIKTNQRFFIQENGEIRNVNAGTLVSEDIVSPYYDFYIMSQQSNKGTTVPNHYKVIFSNSNLEQGIIQQISFSQCFNYVNWSGSIKVPGILQYAKKCVKFNGQIIQRQGIVDELSSKLYYI